MHSQMGFQLHQSHSLTVTGLKGGKKSKYWVSVGLLGRVRDYAVRVGYIRSISDLDANFGSQCVHPDAIFMSASEANFGWLSN